MQNKDIIVEASARMIKSTPRKLNLVAGLIRNKKVAFATMQLQFCTKKAAELINKVLHSAIANAQYNCGLDIDNLYIKEVLVGKSCILRRINPKAMGRANKIAKRYSNICIKLQEIV
ncbi:50S ribosomal protein L22 [Wolbachia endosymbiont of Howardula sp.]|uniref:50S ribosomal protein L22 n=1 Tax=Wolbachia endosymbiont of Howardula sp. TaxID=2916816 RepID=UPI00217D7E51|nr:50S ribosomal protein L22 [Wolbachia endosymbiont of Howardula sp.]UWI83428.1 50S ribosomal protein L22 [Wolbachia endosymbiont of Howardula sp.]